MSLITNFLKKISLVILFSFFSFTTYCQTVKTTNKDFLKTLYNDTSYTCKKERVSKIFAHSLPGHWGEFVKGVDEDLVTKSKTIAFTFDACGGKNGDGFDKELIDFLRKERIPSTLFISGKWIDQNLKTFLELSSDTLFEIENHGLNHRPCSVDGEVAYGIKGTPSVPDAFDEIEANERKIEILTGYRPLFFRSATAYIDEACAKLARQLGVTVVSFDVLAGDAIPFNHVENITKTVLKTIKPGAIVLMHFNHPEWNTYESLVMIIPELRKRGYTFAKLKDYPLKGR